MGGKEARRQPEEELRTPSRRMEDQDQRTGSTSRRRSGTGTWEEEGEDGAEEDSITMGSRRTRALDNPPTHRIASHDSKQATRPLSLTPHYRITPANLTRAL